MKRILITIGFTMGLAGMASAQGSATPASTLQWDQAAPTLAEAQGYTYRHYDDGATGGAVFAGVTCVGAVSPFVCTVPFPAFTPGAHSVTVTAASAAGESLPSTPLPFSFVVIPSVPSNLRIAGGL